MVDPIITRSFEGLKMWSLEVNWDPVISNYNKIMTLTRDKDGTRAELTYNFAADRSSVIVMN